MNRSAHAALVAGGLVALVSACAGLPAPSEPTTPPAISQESDSAALGLGTALINSAAQFAAARSDDQLIAAAMRDLGGNGPTVLRQKQAGGERVAVVLPGANRRYNVLAVSRQFPKLIKRSGSTLTILVPLIAARSTLVTDSRVSEIRISSGPKGHAFLAANRGKLVFAGSSAQRQQIASFDTSTARPDLDPTNGRAYVTVRGGHMRFTDVDAKYLGFNDGVTSGVSWMGTATNPATGGSARSSFTSGRFGAYTSGARGLRIAQSQFARNEIYGFDPHSSTHRTLVEDSEAHDNGRHGFIFSKDCNDNVIRRSRSFSNGGAGFFIDDGNPLRSGIQESNRNVIEGSTATDNRDAGFVIEGGNNNEIRQSRALGGRLGVVVRERATDARIADVSVTQPTNIGIQLTGGSTRSAIEDSDVLAPVGLSVGASTENRVSGLDVTATLTGIRLLTANSASFANTSVHGGGRAAVSVDRSATEIPGVDEAGWVATTPESWRVRAINFVLHPIGATAWILIVCVPLTAWLTTRSRRRREHVRLRAGEIPTMRDR